MEMPEQKAVELRERKLPHIFGNRKERRRLEAEVRKNVRSKSRTRKVETVLPEERDDPLP